MGELGVPALSLVVLVGATGSGGSTFARAHFAATEVLSSDAFRAMVADDENDQSATPDAFELLHAVAGKRLAAGRLTVVDATNVQPEARRSLVALAREHDALPVAVVLDLPERVCAARNAARPDRQFGPHVLRRQREALRRSLRSLGREGFRGVHVLTREDDVAAATVVRTRLYSDLRDQAGLVRGRRGLVQPGLEVRGREYLRIVYGPDCTEPANLQRLRQRHLGHKRSLALREHALELESLERAARGEPLWRVHECVFAVLALESQPVDPRL